MTTDAILRALMRQTFDVMDAQGAFSMPPAPAVPAGYARALAEQKGKPQ